MRICILSSGRHDKQITWEALPEKLRSFVEIVVPATEYDKYNDLGLPVSTTPPSIRGVGPTRQWIIDTSPNKVIMLDDDLTFFARREDEPDKFRKLDSPQELIAPFTEISQLLDFSAHVGMATREGGNRAIEPYLNNTRMLRVLAYRANFLRKRGVRFDRIPVMEDFDVTLQLLRMGAPNVLLNTYVQDQFGSNTDGGCSQYRTMETQAEAAHRLKELHPRFVSVVKKKTKTAWNGQERTDVRVQWKRAFQSSREAVVLDGGERTHTDGERS